MIRPLTKKMTQKEINQAIQAKGGKFLGQYVNSLIKLEIICAFGHRFFKSWNKIKAGQWCSNCSKSISERICREYFEQLFGLPFPSIRPKWLISNKNRPLELDGYCEELNLAFEHNGSQHYKKIPQISIEAFNRIQENDQHKIRILKEKGVRLIIIPELFTKVKLKNLKEFIKTECNKLLVELPNNFDSIQINNDDIYRNEKYMTSNNFGAKISTNNKYRFNNVISVASTKLGKCLSNSYNPYEMEFQCKHNHKWKTTPFQILNGTWCANCEGLIKLSLDICKIEAKNKNGKCLSDSYIGALSKMEWQCEFGHKWFACLSSIKNNHTWCPYCANTRKYTIEECKLYAINKNGICVSNEYKNANSSLNWKCHNGHNFKGCFRVIKNGQYWCPFCKGVGNI